MWTLKRDGTVVRNRDYPGYPPAPSVEGQFDGTLPRGVRPVDRVGKLRAAVRYLARLVRPRKQAGG